MGKGKSNKEVKEIPPAPDGGWGWMIVFASFMIHVFADGIVYSFGIFFSEFLDYFKGGQGETAWIGSLVPGITLTVGPIASALTNRYGCRFSTILGAIIGTAGFILSLFAPNIYYLYFTFGIMSGLGFGLIYLPAIVIVGYYFEKRRAFATGLAVCGSGFGTFIFAPLSKYLLDIYGWKGAILIQSGFILNCVLCGALFRPLEHPKKTKRASSDLAMDSSELAPLSCSQPDIPAIVTPDEPQGNNLEISESNDETKNSIKVLNIEDIRKKILEKRNIKDRNLVANSDGAIHRISHNNGLLAPPARKPGYRAQLSHDATLGPLGRKDIFYQGSVANIPMFVSSPDLYVQSITSQPDELDGTKNWKVLSCFSPAVRNTFQQLLDVSILKNPVFLLFAISNLCTSIGFNMPYIFLPERAREANIDANRAAFLISIIGITNTLGRVLFGWLSDRPYVNRIMLYNSALTVCGIATALSPFCYNYELLCLYAAVFGLFIGVYVSLTSVVLVDLLGLDKLTNSFGLLLLFQGVATLIGPPIAGWLYDATGGYDYSFYIAGSMIALSGLILYFLPCVIKYENRRNPVTQRDIDLGRLPGTQTETNLTEMHELTSAA